MWSHILIHLHSTFRSAMDVAVPAVFLAWHMYVPSSSISTSEIFKLCKSPSFSAWMRSPVPTGWSSFIHVTSGSGIPDTRASSCVGWPSLAFWFVNGVVNTGATGAAKWEGSGLWSNFYGNYPLIFLVVSHRIPLNNKNAVTVYKYLQ